MGSREPELVLGPLATLGLLSLGWAVAKRSRTAAALGFVALVLETNWPAYQRLKRHPRLRDFNLVSVFPDD